MHPRKLVMKTTILSWNRTDKQRKQSMHLKILEQVEISTSRAVKFLDIWLDDNLCFGNHIEKTKERAGSSLTAILTLLPNVGCPKYAKRVQKWAHETDPCGRQGVTISRQQERWRQWSNAECGTWMRRLVPNVRPKKNVYPKELLLILWKTNHKKERDNNARKLYELFDADHLAYIIHKPY